MKLGWTALLNILHGAELRLWAWKRQRSRFRLASVGQDHVALRRGQQGSAEAGAKLPGRRWGRWGCDSHLYVCADRLGSELGWRK